MKHSVLDKKIKAHMAKYKKDTLGITENGVYQKRPYEHILPKLESNLLPMALWPGVIKEDLRSAVSKILFPEKGVVEIEHVKPHVYAKHLNSSQVMCINFFSPLLVDGDGQDILQKLICQATGFSFQPNTKILCYEFEMKPNKDENTSVDLYVKLKTGEEIFFEIKYSEHEFGPADKDAKWRDDHWNSTYRSMCNTSHLLSINDKDRDAFFNHYQIYRNIVLIQDEKRYVCFIYPFVSDVLKKEMGVAQKIVKTTNPKQISEVDWVKLCQVAKELTVNTKYYFHFYLFEQKYIVPLI